MKRLLNSVTHEQIHSDFYCRMNLDGTMVSSLISDREDDVNARDETRGIAPSVLESHILLIDRQFKEVLMNKFSG